MQTPGTENTQPTKPIHTDPNTPEGKKFFQELDDLLVKEIIYLIEMTKLVQDLTYKKHIDELLQKITSSEQVEAAKKHINELREFENTRIKELSTISKGANPDELTAKKESLTTEINKLTKDIAQLQLDYNKLKTDNDIKIENINSKFKESYGKAKDAVINEIFKTEVKDGKETLAINTGALHSKVNSAKEPTNKIDPAKLKPALEKALEPINLSQADFKKAIIEILKNNSPLGEAGKEIIAGQQIQRNALMSHIKALGALHGDEPPNAAQMFGLIKYYDKLGSLMTKLNDPKTTLSQDQMKTVLNLLEEVNTKKDDLTSAQEHLAKLNNALSEVNQKISNHAELNNTPTARRP